MIQTVLAINGCDCMIGDGNTPEELEAIAVTLLRAAEAIRNQEEDAIECVGNGPAQSSLSSTSIIVVRRVRQATLTCPALNTWPCVARRSEPLAPIPDR